MIADETVGTTEEEILPFLQEKGSSGPFHGSDCRIIIIAFKRITPNPAGAATSRSTA
jgi:hypothetical protein